MSRSGARGLVVRSLGAAAVLLLVLPALALAEPTITSITFGGDELNPTITLTGFGFGSKPPATGVALQGYSGDDYGTALYACDLSDDPASFCAGRSTPAGQDSIGLVISAHTDSRIVLRLGSSYEKYYWPAEVYRMQEGDGFAIRVAGTTCTDFVQYTGDPIGCRANPPAGTRVPQILGVAAAGSRLFVKHGSWKGSLLSLHDQWERCGASPGARCIPIPRATRPTYVPVTADVGHTLAVYETASDPGGTSQQPSISNPSPVVQPALRRNKHQHQRVLAAAARLLEHRSLRVRLAVVLGGGLVQTLGLKHAIVLYGEGLIEPQRGRVSWSLALPKALGGKRLQVVIVHKLTYVRLGGLTGFTHRRWLRLRVGQLARLPRVGLTGRLAMLLDPDATIRLLRATGSAVFTQRTGHPDADTRRRASAPDAGGCTYGSAATITSSAVVQRALGEVGFTGSAYREAIDRLDPGFRVAGELTGGGSLTGTRLTDPDGLTVEESFCASSTRLAVAAPQASEPVTGSSTVALTGLDPCLVGEWALDGPLPNPQGYPIAEGSLTLTIDPDGAARMDYDEYSDVGDEAGGVFGLATMTVAAPPGGDELVWALSGDDVVQIFFDPATETPPFTEDVGSSGITATPYSCTDGKLSVRGPIGNDSELNFVRTSQLQSAVPAFAAGETYNRYAGRVVAARLVPVQVPLPADEADPAEPADAVIRVVPDAGAIEPAESDVEVVTNPDVVPQPSSEQTTVAHELEQNNPDLSDGEADEVADECAELEEADDEASAQSCDRLPIFLTGADAAGASRHDLAAIGAISDPKMKGQSIDPGWIFLNYRPASKNPSSRGWYRGRAPCTLPTPAGDNCDEYPLFATEQGGADASPLPNLEYINGAQNQLQGRRYGAFIKRCKLSSGQQFLAIPVPPNLPAVTTGLCNS